MTVKNDNKTEELEVIDFNEMDLETAWDQLSDPGSDEKADLDKLTLDKKKEDDEKKEDDGDQAKEDKSSDDDTGDDDKKTDDDDDKSTDDDNKSDDDKVDDKASDNDDKSSDDDTDDGAEETLVDELRTRLGIETDASFEDNVDGLVELSREAAGQLAEQQLTTLFAEYPDIEEYMQFRLQGGDANLFFETMYPTEDYATLTVGEDDTPLQERLVRKALVAMGNEEEDIASAIEEYKTSGILHSQAQRSLKGLIKHQSREKEQLTQRQQGVADQEAKDQEAHLKEVNDTIKNSADFHGIVVSEKDKAEFATYVSTPVQNGQSQFQIDMQEAPTDIYLAIAALMKRKFNLDGIVTRKAKSLNASNMRERLKNNSQEKLRSQEDGDKGHTDIVNVGDLNLSLG